MCRRDFPSPQSRFACHRACCASQSGFDALPKSGPTSYQDSSRYESNTAPKFGGKNDALYGKWFSPCIFHLQNSRKMNLIFPLSIIRIMLLEILTRCFLLQMRSTTLRKICCGPIDDMYSSAGLPHTSRSFLNTMGA